MAGYQGIKSVSGVSIGNIAKVGSVTKANIWSLSGEQREASLFKALQNADWASYTAGKNSASFVAVGQSGARAYVFFQYDGHTSGDSYQFDFIKTGTQSDGRIMSCAAATNTDFTTDARKIAIGTDSGVTTKSILNYSQAASGTIYLGVIKDNAASTDTLDIANLLITKL